MSTVEQRFGPYGGRYVPETLIPALDELTAAWVEARSDAEFMARLDQLRRDFIGRPTPLYLAERLSERVGSPGLPEARGPLPHRLPQDQQRDRPVAAGRADGQAAGDRRDRRRPARGRDRDRLRPVRARMRRLHGDRGHPPPGAERRADGLLGAEVAPVEAGARTLKEAVSAAIRDWVANVATTHYVIGSAVGPAPFPALVRDLQRVIGEEAREQALAAEESLPARVIACVGGGSNAIGIFTPFIGDAEVALVGVEAAGEGLDTGATGLRSRRGQGCPARLAFLGDRR